jgi:hypothetical protein
MNASLNLKARENDPVPDTGIFDRAYSENELPDFTSQSKRPFSLSVLTGLYSAPWPTSLLYRDE